MRNTNMPHINDLPGQLYQRWEARYEKTVMTSYILLIYKYFLACDLYNGIYSSKCCILSYALPIVLSYSCIYYMLIQKLIRTSGLNGSINQYRQVQKSMECTFHMESDFLKNI